MTDWRERPPHISVTDDRQLNKREIASVRILELEIKNWKKHNPRADVKTCSWFKMSNDYFTDPEFYGVSIIGKILWIYLLSQASKKVSPVIKINTLQVANTLQISIEEIDYSLLELFKTGSLNEVNSTRSDSSGFVSLEERRGEKKREEENREEETQTSTPEKNLPEIQPQDFRNSKGSAKFTPDHFRDLWNEFFTGALGSCKGLGSGIHRDRFLKAIGFLPSEHHWRELFEICLASDWLMGRTEHRFKLTPTWIVDHDNIIKIQEGRYKNKPDGLHSSLKNKSRITKGNPTGDPYRNDDGTLKELGA
jgi:hypothetical protein